MHAVIRNLFDKISSASRDSHVSVSYLAMLIEKSTRRILIERFGANFEPGLEFYTDLLTAELDDLIVSEEEQREIVATIVDTMPVVDAPGIRASMIWALSKTLPWISSPHLLALLYSDLSVEDDEYVYQLLSSIDKEAPGIFADPALISSDIFDREPALTALRRIIDRRSDTGRPQLLELAQRLLMKFENYTQSR